MLQEAVSQRQRQRPFASQLMVYALAPQIDDGPAAAACSRERYFPRHFFPARPFYSDAFPRGQSSRRRGRGLYRYTPMTLFFRR